MNESSRTRLHKILLGPTVTLLGKDEWLILLSKLKRSYRGPIEITANILEVARAGSRKTRIMYLGNLSYELTQKYLKQLRESQLIEIQENNGEKIFKLTPKGEGFLTDYYELQKHTEIVDDKKRNLQGALKVRAQ